MPARGRPVVPRKWETSQLAVCEAYRTNGGGAPRAKGRSGGTRRRRWQRRSRDGFCRGRVLPTGGVAVGAMGGFTRDPPTTGAKRDCNSEADHLRGQRRGG